MTIARPYSESVRMPRPTRLRPFHFLMLCLLSLALLSAACGRKGDLIRPGKDGQQSSFIAAPLTVHRS